MTRILRSLALSLVALMLAACATSSQSIMAISPRTHLEGIFIETNPDVHVPAMEPEMYRLLNHLGYYVTIVDKGEAPEGAPVLTYDARLEGGQNLKTVVFIKLELRRNGRLLGQAIFDADSDSLNKFGNTHDKLTPLIEGMFEYVRPDSIKQ